MDWHLPLLPSLFVRAPSRSVLWRSAAITLGGLFFLRLGALTSLAVLVYKGYFVVLCGAAGSQPLPFSKSGFVFENTLLTTEGLKDHLCDVSNVSTCEICPYSWLLSRGRCYFFSEEFNSWNSSLEYCNLRQSDLMTIDDQSEIDLIEMNTKRSLYSWISLRYDERREQWGWLDGSILTNGNISVRFQRSGCNCGSIRGNEVQPENCISKNKWICEKKAVVFAP
ncbi:killer cell lectin-like receptor subfamily F member 1 [Ambystoma mexicanum]|uniref:killer cell lectin-like receptor subfamily F member 1 n=1 Tax=Ambystoma mexicanum TaxID=8296 RepID=UPI0037E845F3